MDIWNLIAGPILSIIGKLIPDKTAAAAAQAQLQQMVAQGAIQEELAQLQAVTTAQSDINKVEAASTSLFVAGWRPYVGWICGTGLGLQVIVAPLFTWFSALIGHPTQFPKFDDVLLQSTLAGMLGLGYGLRTFEKFHGVAGNH
jgi:hypothetical protein